MTPADVQRLAVALGIAGLILSSAVLSTGRARLECYDPKSGDGWKGPRRWDFDADGDPWLKSTPKGLTRRVRAAFAAGVESVAA